VPSSDSGFAIRNTRIRRKPRGIVRIIGNHPINILYLRCLQRRSIHRADRSIIVAARVLRF